MKLCEFCHAYDIPLTIEASLDGYIITLGRGRSGEKGHFAGILDDDLEHYADNVDGGTTSRPGMGGKTPDEAAHEMCAFIRGRLLRFDMGFDERGYSIKPYRHVRAPEELTP